MRNLRLPGELSVKRLLIHCALCAARPKSDALQPWVQPKQFYLEHFAFTLVSWQRSCKSQHLGLHSSVWKGRDESTDASVCPHQTLIPPLPQSVLPLALCPVPSSDFPDISHFSVQLTSPSNLSPHRPGHMCLVLPGCYLLGLLLLDSLTLLLSSLKLDSFSFFSIWAEKRNCYFSSTSTFLILVSLPWWESLFIPGLIWAQYR